MSKIKAADLPVDLVAVIYYCHACDGKHTFGRDFMAETGAYPDACPACGAVFVQDDRVARVEADAPEDLEARKRDLFAKRGRALPVERKPDNPEEIRTRRIRTLEDELGRLKAAPNVPPASGPRPGP